MISLTSTRAEWAALAGVIAAANPATIPPGLAERIDALLRETPETWPDEPCVLEFEPETAAVAQLLTAQGRGVAAAEQVLHSLQQGNADATHRIEHRTGGISSVVAYLTDVATLRQELVRHGARLRAAAATGELVLVEQASLDELAHLPLYPEPGSGKRPS
ncbi:MAG TPA: hypothetical protein VM450_08690 [Thermomicrobiales bacterium]|nr:hypothetical protein [Thermomicrobiales bacterium]